jgi:hypothetical protein
MLETLLLTSVREVLGSTLDWDNTVLTEDVHIFAKSIQPFAGTLSFIPTP